MEVCYDHGATNLIHAPSLRDSVLQYFQPFGLARRRYRLFERRIDCSTASFINGEVVEEEEVALRLREVRDLFENHSCFVDLGEDQEKIVARCYGCAEMNKGDRS